MEYNDEKYEEMKAHFLAIFNSMNPNEFASQEMQDAFDNALEDFCSAHLGATIH